MNIKITIAQLNFIVGDIDGNADKVIEAALLARDQHQADMVVFPEMALSGYPPEDLLLRADFYPRINAALERIAKIVNDIYLVIGYPEAGKLPVVFNSMVVIYNGAIIANYRKQLLPNSGVFDEKRYFVAGKEACVVEIKGHKIALTICEDLWFKEPLAKAKKLGAKMALSINASPFAMYKQLLREKIMGERAREQGIPIMYVNTVGGQDELVFDGGSFVMDKDGVVVRRIESFEEKIITLEFAAENNLLTKDVGLPGYGSTEQRIYAAIVLGLRDYITKNNFPGVLLGVSGGVDSALTLALAVDALGAERVKAVFLPSRYSSKMSKDDVKQLAKNFQVELLNISIWPIFKRYLKSLKKVFAGLSPDVTEENLQARIRGTLLMALSNKKNLLVLATSNKSEIATGYTTLYGDMVGGFAPLKDVFKTIVYQLAEHRNSVAGFDIIPRRVLDRAPTAELRPNQKDSDTLPPYATLDPILERYIEKDEALEQIVAAGFNPDLVEMVINMVKRSEYKRRQAPIGPRISSRNFGRDRRYPVTSHF